MADPRHAALILEGHSAYNNFSMFYTMVARTLQAAGLDVVRVDMRDGKTAAGCIEGALKTYTQPYIVAAFTLNGLGTDIGDDTAHGNMWQHLRIPVVSWMGDHPCYYLARHRHQTKAVMPLYEYKDFLDFHRDYVRSAGRVAYNPFGVWDFGKPPKRRMRGPSETPLVVLPKTAGDPMEMEKAWQSMLPKPMLRIVHDAIEDYWGSTRRSGPVSFSVLRAADAAGLELRNDLTQFCFLIAQIDDYIRRRKATLLVQSLLPLPVKIYGQGFMHIDASHARAEILPPLDYASLVDHYYEADAIVTMNPNVDDECHDRVYSAFGCGAMPVTDINPWWEKNYPGLLPYSYDFRDRPPLAAVERILADPEKAAALAWEYHEIARQKRTFEKTVIEALDLAIMHRYYTFNFRAPQPYYTKIAE